MLRSWGDCRSNRNQSSTRPVLRITMHLLRDGFKSQAFTLFAAIGLPQGGDDSIRRTTRDFHKKSAAVSVELKGKEIDGLLINSAKMRKTACETGAAYGRDHRGLKFAHHFCPRYAHFLSLRYRQRRETPIVRNGSTLSLSTTLESTVQVKGGLRRSLHNTPIFQAKGALSGLPQWARTRRGLGLARNYPIRLRRTLTLKRQDYRKRRPLAAAFIEVVALTTS